MLAWHEVREMGLSRALWRAGYELRKRLGLLARARGPDPDDPRAVLAEFTQPFADEGAMLAHFRGGGRGRFFFDADRREEYVSAIERIGAVEAAVAAADEVCAHRFELLGQRFDFAPRCEDAGPETGGEIDWHREPQSGRSWPAAPWNRVDLRSRKRLGDVKFTWELNRHQFWPSLGEAYWLTGDEKYPREWVEQFESWHAQNPPEIGVNWASNLEHALRIVSWWMAARLMVRSPAVTPGTRRRLIGLLICKARHILADLDYSRVNMANNHLIGDAVGLAALGLALPELRDARRWRNLGLGILWRQARRQIHADGSSIESSAGYHRFVLQLYLLAIALADRNNVPVPARVRERVDRMAGFVAAAVRPDGTLPQFGDGDSGAAYRLSDARLHDFRPVLGTAAVLLGGGDLKRAAGRLDPETIWLLGPEAAGAFERLDAGSDPGRSQRRAFEGAGLFFDRARRRGICLFVRNGPFTSHTHADLLSLCLHADGGPVLCDGGTYTYNGEWAWRTYFRTTRAHNAVTVDAAGQALAHRVFRWLMPPRARNHFFADDGPFVFDGQHDGFRRLGVTHRRIILGVDAAAWLCLDVLRGGGTHDVGVHWHPAPDLAAEAGPSGAVIVRRGDRPVLTIAAAANRALAASVARGEEPGGASGPAGWHSPEYGRKVPACEVTYSARGSMPLCVATVLALGASAPAPAAPVLEGGEVRVRLRPCPSDLRQAGRKAADTVDITYHLRPKRTCRSGEIAEVGRVVRPGGRAETLLARCLEKPT